MVNVRQGNYEIREYRFWKHTSGARASVYGACPWTSPSGKADWTLTTDGYTIFDYQTNTSGFGRPPFKTEAEAQSFIDTKLSAR